MPVAIPVLTPAESSAWDGRAEEAGIALETLMANAGRAAAGVLLDRYPHAVRQGVLVATGPGNNGGDGWVMARALHRLAVPIWVVPAAGRPSGLSGRMSALAQAEGVRVLPADGPWPAVGLVVDALLGTGASGPPRESIATLLQRLVDLELPILAIDGPTGLDLASGVSHGTPRAGCTVTFGGLRRGHLLARDECGDVVVCDIGHPPLMAGPELFTDDLAAHRLPQFTAREHKGSRGRVVIVGGGEGMTGAARLAGRAAFAAGAGLVHVAAPAASIATIAQAEPDLQTLAWEGDGLPPAVGELLTRTGAVVIGPGLGRGAGTLARATTTLGTYRGPVVLDADGLTAFRGQVDLLRSLVGGRDAVLTPHLGEFRALFPDLGAVAEHDPWGAATTAAKALGATIVLKGVPTVVATGEEGPRWTVASGNPGLATGGSGDLLSGLIGTFLARGVAPALAAALGAQALGRAADLGARRVTARGLRPMDVLAALPDLWRSYEMRRTAPSAPRGLVLFELERPRNV